MIDSVMVIVWLSFAYALLILVAVPRLTSTRPRPSFWTLVLLSTLSPFLAGVQLLGKVLLYSGAGVLGLINLLVDKLAPPRQTGPYEDRLDLH